MAGTDRPRQQGKPTRAVALWLATALWAATIFWLSSTPGSQLPGRFSVFGHLGEYFIFATLLYWAVRTSGYRRYAAVIAIAVASLYGVTDEFHQHFVTLRTPDVADWGLDTIGATTAALVSAACAGFLDRRVANGPARAR